MAAAAQELARTALERRCLDEVRRASDDVDGPMERHGTRCFLLIERLAARRGADIDREVALCAAFVHDIGIYPSVSRGGVYTDESGELAAQMFAEVGAARTSAALRRRLRLPPRAPPTVGAGHGGRAPAARRPDRGERRPQAERPQP